MNIPNINIGAIAQSIALLPETVRSTIDYALWNHAIMKARINGTDPDLEGDDAALHAVDEQPEGADHSECADGMCVHNAPYTMWEAGRRALEFMMLVRHRDEFGDDDFGDAMDAAMPDLDSPQHAIDVVLALANMANVVADEDDIATFARMFLDAEARAS